MQEGTGWHKDVLALPGCAAGLDEAARLVWQALLNGNGLWCHVITSALACPWLLHAAPFSACIVSQMVHTWHEVA